MTNCDRRQGPRRIRHIVPVARIIIVAVVVVIIFAGLNTARKAEHSNS